MVATELFTYCFFECAGGPTVIGCAIHHPFRIWFCLAGPYKQHPDPTRLDRVYRLSTPPLDLMPLRFTNNNHTLIMIVVVVGS
jgi:hypothetical protein